MSSAILRQASSVARAATRSCAFSTSAVARRDFVQELYLKELKSYKAPPPPKDAHVGVVKAYSLPPAPQAPALPADLASELSAYDAAEPTFAASAKPAESEESSGPTGADAFLAFLEADEPKAEAHH
ncbi:ATP synthase complex subunit H-domain-containing protein [Cubamyces lactineus]|nr:ATP synthase complex subunit H-domain-containing protein [Cubamyces lactineus]